MDAVNTLIESLRAADYDAREALKAQLIVLAKGADGTTVREELETIKRGELLEIQWEIDDILEASAPPPPEAPAEAPSPVDEPAPQETPTEPEQPERLTAADLDLVYDDPRGLMLHKSKVGERWFATQVDPSTGMPQTFELHSHEIEQLKAQLLGSPYWRVGS